MWSRSEHLGQPFWCSAAAAAAKLLQSCPTLCDPRDGSPPGFPVPGILQARTLGGRVTTQTPINLGETDLIP